MTPLPASPGTVAPINAIAGILSTAILRLHRRGMLMDPSQAAAEASKFSVESLESGLDVCDSSRPCVTDAVSSHRDTQKGDIAWH